MSPETLPQQTLQNLARGVPRQRGVGELHASRNLVISERATAERHQVIGADGLSRCEHDTRGHELAPFLVWNAEHRGFMDRRMLEQDRLDFAGVDVLAARDDHVLAAIEDEEEILGVAIPDVSGPEIAIA